MYFPLVHRIAIGLIAVAAITQLTGLFVSTEYWLPLGTRIVHLVAGCAFWAFLIWKMWKRPRTWGLGVGLVFTGMFILQSYLWYSAATDSGLRLRGVEYSVPVYVFTKVPLALAAIGCFLVRRQARKADSAA